MDNALDQGQVLDVQQLLRLHTITNDVTKLCEKQLRDYLDAMAPLFRARRVLGEHIEGAGRESVAGADQNLAELRELYQRVAGRPFDLRRELSTPLESISTQIQLYEWDYLHEVRTENNYKTVTVKSPMTWVLCYPSTYSPSMLVQVLAGRQARDPDSVRDFVLRACLMNLLFAKQPTLTALFEGLRYRVEVRKSPQFGDLPAVTVSAPFRTMRPPDHLVLVATGLSGGKVFQEVLDLESARQMHDPLRDQVYSILRAQGEDL